MDLSEESKGVKHSRNLYVLQIGSGQVSNNINGM